MWGTHPEDTHSQAVPMCIQVPLKNHFPDIKLVQTLLSHSSFAQSRWGFTASFSCLINNSPSHYISLLSPPHSSLECFGTAWISGCLGKTISFIMHRQSREHISQSRGDGEIGKSGAQNAERERSNERKKEVMASVILSRQSFNVNEEAIRARKTCSKNKNSVWWCLIIHKKSLSLCKANIFADVGLVIGKVRVRHGLGKNNIIQKTVAELQCLCLRLTQWFTANREPSPISRVTKRKHQTCFYWEKLIHASIQLTSKMVYMEIIQSTSHSVFLLPIVVFSYCCQLKQQAANKNTREVPGNRARKCKCIDSYELINLISHCFGRFDLLV